MNITLDKARLIWDRAVIGMAFISADGRWLRANPALCELLEYTEEELQAKKFEDITHPEDTNSDWLMARKVITGERDSYVMAKRYLTKRGHIVWTKLRVDRVEENGEFVHFLSQVVPADVVELRPPIADPDDVSREDIELGNVLLKFIKDNFKTVAAAVMAIVGSGYGLWVKFEEVRIRSESQEKVVREHIAETAAALIELREAIKNLSDNK